MLGAGPLGAYPLGGFDTTYSRSVADSLTAILEDPSIPASWLLRAYPRDKSTSTDPPTLLSLEVSTDGHRAPSTDTEILQYPEALINPYSMSYGLGGNNLHGLVKTNSGKIVVSDLQGDHRSLCDEDWIGRQCDVYLGPRGGTEVQFGRVARLISRDHSYTRFDLTLITDDYSFIFDRPLQTNRYAGTGGLEGDAEVQGIIKPTCLGVVRQIEPVLVTGNIYQAHDGSAESISNMEVGGVAETFNTDVADIEASTPPAGTYNTALATGHVRFETDPSDRGVVTCDVEGHNSSSYGYVETLTGLLRLLAVVYAGVADPDELDTAAFDSLAITETAPMGIYVSGRKRASLSDIEMKLIQEGLLKLDDEDSPSIGSTMMTFLRSSSTWGWMKPEKIFTNGKIVDPDNVTVGFQLYETKDDIVDWEDDPFETPVNEVVVGYKPYYRTLSQDEVTGDSKDIHDRGQGYRYVSAPASPSTVQIESSRSITILTSLDVEADAQALANSEFALRGTPLRLKTVTPRLGMIKRGIGDGFELHDNLLPFSPRKMVILDVDNDAEDGKVVWLCLSR